MGYLLSVLGQAERERESVQTICVCVVEYRCFSRTERESGKTEKLPLIRALRGASASNQSTQQHVSIMFLHPFTPILLPPKSKPPPLRELLSLEALSFLGWDICLFPAAIQ